MQPYSYDLEKLDQLSAIFHGAGPVCLMKLKTRAGQSKLELRQIGPLK